MKIFRDDDDYLENSEKSDRKAIEIGRRCLIFKVPPIFFYWVLLR